MLQLHLERMQMNRFEDALSTQSRKTDALFDQLRLRIDQLEGMIRNHLTISHPKEPRGRCVCMLVLGKNDPRCIREYGHAGAHETLCNNWKYTWEQLND